MGGFIPVLPKKDNSDHVLSQTTMAKRTLEPMFSAVRHTNPDTILQQRVDAQLVEITSDLRKAVEEFKAALKSHEEKLSSVLRYSKQPPCDVNSGKANIVTELREMRKQLVETSNVMYDQAFDTSKILREFISVRAVCPKTGIPLVDCDGYRVGKDEEVVEGCKACAFVLPGNYNGDLFNKRLYG